MPTTPRAVLFPGSGDRAEGYLGKAGTLKTCFVAFKENAFRKSQQVVLSIRYVMKALLVQPIIVMFGSCRVPYFTVNIIFSGFWERTKGGERLDRSQVALIEKDGSRLIRPDGVFTIKTITSFLAPNCCVLVV